MASGSPSLISPNYLGVVLELPSAPKNVRDLKHLVIVGTGWSFCRARTKHIPLPLMQPGRLRAHVTLNAPIHQHVPMLRRHDCILILHRH